ncbi:hypothetical protein HanOQP8_Chr10g0350511 [Helianthus annuus]|nr:hypothetical protein HanOQP8_Chr10g0350511 [Helianthus annuus]
MVFFIFYDDETTFFEDGVRTAKQKQLEEKLLQVMLLFLFSNYFDY